MKHFAAFFLAFVGMSSALAQIDDEFWFVAPEVTSLHEDAPVRVRMATFSMPAEVELSMPANAGFSPIQVSIPAGEASTIDLTPFLTEVENQPFNEVLNKGLLLQSSTAISAYYEVGQTLNTDIFALKGENGLGTSFHLPFQTFANNIYPTSPAGFDVVATEDNTVVTIMPSQDLVGHPAGTPFQIALPQAGSTYSARAAGIAAGVHPVGTTITADKPVAVSMHDDSANSSFFGGCYDLMGDQLVPDDLLGTDHIVVSGFLSPHDRLQILATEDNTTITVDGGFVATLQEGQAHEYVLAAPSAFIQSTAPVSIWQTTGFGCEFGGALLPHVECTGSKSAVFVRSTGETMFFNLIVPAGAENDFLFNGNSGVLNGPSTSFFPVPGNPDWMFAQITTLEGQIPVGEATRIENTTSEFHMGIINGGGNTGTRYGYFTDYGALKYRADNQSVNPCVGDPLVMAVDSVENGLYQWTGPNDFEFTGLVVDLGESELNDSGLYVVQGYDGECPIQNDTIEVVVHNPLPAPVLSDDFVTCEGLTVAFGADVDNVIWSGPNDFESEGQYVTLLNTSAADAGTYVATIVDPFCPEAAASIVVDVETEDDLTFAWEKELDFCPGEDKWVNLPGELALDNPSVEWYWQPASGSDPILVSTAASLAVEGVGTYFAESTTEGPCPTRGSGVVEVLPADCNLVVPNVITPGNDDKNNRFAVRNLGQFPFSTVRIYNRWGIEVYRDDDFGNTNGWLPSEDVSAGLYFYTLHIARQEQQISIETAEGVTTYTEFGPIDLYGSITVIK